MLLAIITIIIMFYLFYNYMTWASSYYASINRDTVDENTGDILIAAEDKRKNYRYYLLPPRAVADSAFVLFYWYKMFTGRYIGL